MDNEIIKTEEELMKSLTKYQQHTASKLLEKYKTFCKQYHVEPVFDYLQQIRNYAVGEIAQSRQLDM